MVDGIPARALRRRMAGKVHPYAEFRRAAREPRLRVLQGLKTSAAVTDPITPGLPAPPAAPPPSPTPQPPRCSPSGPDQFSAEVAP